MALNNSTAMMTVFVPINAAFDALAMQMNQTLDVIMARKDVLKQVPPSRQLHHSDALVENPCHRAPGEPMCVPIPQSH